MALYRNIAGFFNNGMYEEFSTSEDLSAFGSLRDLTATGNGYTTDITTMFRAPDSVIQPVLTSPVSPAPGDDIVIDPGAPNITTLFRPPDDTIQPVTQSPVAPVGSDTPIVIDQPVVYISDTGTQGYQTTPGTVPILVDPIIPAPTTSYPLPVLQHPDVSTLNQDQGGTDWVPLLTLGGLVITMVTGESIFKSKRKLAFVAGLGVLYYKMSKK